MQIQTDAGQGEHCVYRIASENSSDGTVLTPGKHYIGIDAVAWYINKASSWHSERVASGTLEIKLANGMEKYQAALGTYELKGGAKVAPVFERSVLPDRNFRGGSITLSVSLTGIKNDAVICSMLKSAASASLGIVAGMVQTASFNGPSKLLVAAGEDLIGGVNKILTDTADKREPLFDFSGLEYTIQPSSLVGSETYFLFHRGSKLPEEKLSIKLKGKIVLPYVGSSMIEDGAWILLRLRRSDEYSGVRDWYEDTRKLRRKLNSLVEDVHAEGISKEDALKQLKPSNTEDTVYNEFVRLRNIIGNDGVLSEREANLYVGQLAAALRAAKEAITKQTPEFFKGSLMQLEQSLSLGKPLRDSVGKAFVDEVVNLTTSRKSGISSGNHRRVTVKPHFALVSKAKLRGVKAAKHISENQVFSEMQFLTKSIKRSSRF